MALPTTADFDDLYVEVSDDGGTTWNKICGLVDFTVDYQTQTDTDELPDCADESLPLTQVQNVRSIGLVVQGTGKWSAEGHEQLLQWWKQGLKKTCRVGYNTATSGDVEFVSGTATFSMQDSRTKGQTVSRNVTITFAGEFTLTDKT